VECVIDEAGKISCNVLEDFVGHASEDYRAVLREHGLRGSMGRRDGPTTFPQHRVQTTGCTGVHCRRDPSFMKTLKVEAVYLMAIPVYDARTDQISELGLQYGTKPGFYMMPRIFMSDTPEDHAAIQPALSQIQFYPLSQFDGKMKTKDWSKIPKMEKPGVPAKYSTTQPPWVDPATFFDQLPAVMHSILAMSRRADRRVLRSSIEDAAYQLIERLCPC
jgi:hypothetical protein